MITLPIYYTETFKTKPPKVWLVGMNAYRNWHYHLSNKVKSYFTYLVNSQTTSYQPITGQFKLSIVIYYKNSSCDGSNIASLMEKFTLDALIKSNIIPNDNVKYHLGTTWSIGNQDTINPRAEITLEEIT